MTKKKKKTIQCAHAVMNVALTGLYMRPVYTPRYVICTVYDNL